MKTFILIILLAPCSLFAQRNDSTRSRSKAPVFILKWSPLHLMVNRFPTVQFAAEYRIGDYTSIQVDGGPVIHYDDDQDTRSNFNMRGFKLKGEVRYYLTRINGGWRYYIAPELYYNKVDYDKFDTFGINCEDGNCDYFQYGRYKMEYREGGLNVKFGAMVTFGRFCLDYHVGLAARFIRYTPIGMPAGELMYAGEGDMFDFTSEETRNIVQPTTCIRVGFVLVK